MMEQLTVLSLGSHMRLGDILEHALDGVPFQSCSVSQAKQQPLTGQRVLFAVSLDEYGAPMEAIELLRYLRGHSNWLEGAVGAVLLDGRSELYTKDFARTLIFEANRCGCRFPSRPLVEATGGLKNFSVLSGVQGVDRYTAYRNAAKTLVLRLLEDAPPRVQRPNLLLLHASNRARSNTLALGLEVTEQLKDTCDVTELSLLSGAIYDCNGCGHKACVHYAEQETCFYGGVVPETVFPAIDRCDGLLLCCPNYNDAPGAHFLALNNRLNALLLRGAQFDKTLFAVIVSGYSGGDIVAEQLLGGFCLNKPFRLPPNFALLETANDPSSALELPGIKGRITAFANNIKNALV